MSNKLDNRQFDKEAFTFVNSDRVLTDVKLDTKPVGYLKDAWHRFKKNKASVAATVIIAIIAVFAIIAPFCTPYQINQADGNYKQVRPKVSASARGFWDGGYSANANDVRYIYLQGIGISALDPNGTIMRDWDDNYWNKASSFAYNPILKVGNANTTVVNVDGVDKSTTFRKIRIDSYYEVGFVYINGLTYEQYHDILNWQEATGKQVVYPILDHSDDATFPASNKGDAGEANYWYAMTKTLTPLWPNDPDDLSQGYHEMTLDEVKEKGLWALYAQDYERDETDSPYYYSLTGEKYVCTTLLEADEVKGYGVGDVLFEDVEGNLIYRYVKAEDGYVDAQGNALQLVTDNGSVYFRGEGNALIGAITRSKAFHDAQGNALTAVTDENRNVDYYDEEEHLVYHFDAATGVYSDKDGNVLTKAAGDKNVFLTNDKGQLIGGVQYQRLSYDETGALLTVATAQNGDVSYYKGDQLLCKYIAATKSYQDKDGKALALSLGAGSVYFENNAHRIIGWIKSDRKGSTDQDGNKLTKSTEDGWTLYKLNDGTVEYKMKDGVYYDGEDNALTVPSNADNRYFTNGAALTFEDSYRDIDDTPLYLVNGKGAVVYYKNALDETVYLRDGKTYYLGTSDTILNPIVPSADNVFFVAEDGTVASALMGSGLQYHDKDGNLLTVVESENKIEYYKGEDLLYTCTIDGKVRTYADGEGNALTLTAKGGAYFVDHNDQIVAGIQAPVANAIKMVDITSSGAGGQYKNYRIRVLYYNYYQYLNDHEPVFVLGADAQGYDILVRLAHGCRLSLLLAVAVSLINLVIGAIYGAIEGYYGGVVDMVMERITDILAGVPFIVLVALFRLHLVDTGKVSILGGLLFAFVVTGWIGTAYATRMQFYRFKGQEYILAARTLGANDWRLMFKHIFPNALGTLITSSVLVIPGVIFSETSLAYLGIVNFNGQNMTSLGTMLSNGQNSLYNFPHIILFPALILSLLMISFNLFGNGLRDAFNPSLRGTED